MASASTPALILYGWYKSSCSARLRIALAYKSIPFTPINVDYAASQHHGEDYAAMNPSKSVPTLVVDQPGEEPRCITQSVSALEYLDEAYPDAPALLPAGPPLQRARVRGLVQIICGDVQPVTNSRVLERIAPLGHDTDRWGRDFHARGLAAYEGLIRETAGSFSVGDAVTMADVCLAPAVWNATKHELPLDGFPTVARVYGNLMELPAFQDGHYSAQPDCPENEK